MAVRWASYTVVFLSCGRAREAFPGSSVMFSHGGEFSVPDFRTVSDRSPFQHRCPFFIGTRRSNHARYKAARLFQLQRDTRHAAARGGMRAA